VPEPVRELLATRVDSFEKLELVMTLLHAPGRTLSVPDLATALQIPRDVVRRLVMELRAASLVELTLRGQIQLQLPSPADERAFAELSRLYRSDPVHVIRLLSDIAMERIRTMASRAFAKAFTLRKKDGSGDDGQD
jgi:DNA-binding GntR family transcriptional regulator